MAEGGANEDEQLKGIVYGNQGAEDDDELRVGVGVALGRFEEVLRHAGKTGGGVLDADNIRIVEERSACFLALTLIPTLIHLHLHEHSLLPCVWLDTTTIGRARMTETFWNCQRRWLITKLGYRCPRLDWERPMSRWLIRELTRDSLARWRVRGKYLVKEGLTTF